VVVVEVELVVVYLVVAEVELEVVYLVAVEVHMVVVHLVAVEAHMEVVHLVAVEAHTVVVHLVAVEAHMEVVHLVAVEAHMVVVHLVVAEVERSKDDLAGNRQIQTAPLVAGAVPADFLERAAAPAAGLPRPRLVPAFSLFLRRRSLISCTPPLLCIPQKTTPSNHFIRITIFLLPFGLLSRLLASSSPSSLTLKKKKKNRAPFHPSTTNKHLYYYIK